MRKNLASTLVLLRWRRVFNTAGHRFPGCIGLRQSRSGDNAYKTVPLFVTPYYAAGNGCNGTGHRSAADPAGKIRAKLASADRAAARPASFLRPSILANGLDPKTLIRAEGSGVNISGGGSNAKAWRDIWSAGQGIGAVKSSGPAGDYIEWLAADYSAARHEMGMAQA